MPSVAVNTEINPATTPIVVALNILQERVKVLSHELPGVTFGYIGNLERWGDDRSWAVFLPPRSCRHLRRSDQHRHHGEASRRRR
jgi:hypothetical protein